MMKYDEHEEYNNSDLMTRDTAIEPNHYTSFKVQPNRYIVDNNLGWYEGNVVKYVTRHKMKNGKEDLLKAIKYLELLLEEEYENSSIR